MASPLPLDVEQDELVRTVGALVDSAGGDTARLRAALVQGGWWTLGTPAAVGGGGADLAETALVLARVARGSAAVAWLSVQAHLGVGLLGGRPEWREVVGGIHSGEVAFAAVPESVAGCLLTESEEFVTGTIARVDLGDSRPMIGVLEPDGALLLTPEAIVEARELPRTGLADTGARTVTVSGQLSTSALRIAADAAELRRRRYVGTAAVATGLAWEAADRAARYVRERHQFGGPLLSLPAVQEGERARWSAVAASVRGLLAADRTSLPAAADLASASLAAAVDVVTSALLAHGGYGYLQEYGIESLLRDALSLRAAVDTQAARRDAHPGAAPA